MDAQPDEGEVVEGEVVDDAPRAPQIDLEQELDDQRRMLSVTKGQLARAMRAGDDVDPSKIDALARATTRLANLEHYFRLRALTRHGG